MGTEVRTVYITIGNSDDRLSQRTWSAYVKRVNGYLESVEHHRHGFWLTESSSMFQNACWCVEVGVDRQVQIKEVLGTIAALFLQESIAYAPANVTFIKARGE